MKIFLVLWVIVSGIDALTTDPLPKERIVVDIPYSFDTMADCYDKRARTDVLPGNQFVQYELTCEIIE